MLDLPVSKLPHIGPVYEKRLAKLGILRLKDLIYHFPFRYKDFSNIKKTVNLELGEVGTVIGELSKIQNIYTKGRKKITEGAITDSEGSLKIVWFNQHFLTRTLKAGMKVAISGKLEEFSNKKTLISPEYEILKEGEEKVHTGRLVPVYPETARISSKWLRRKIFNLLKKVSLSEFLPDYILEKEKFSEINQAFCQIHFPENYEEAKKARQRFAFEELFLLQTLNLQRKSDWKKNQKSPVFRVNQKKLFGFLESLPFELTEAQKKATDRILNDLQQEIPMNRLLEGDVGSGKTVVACVASFIAFLNGYQIAFMAPTEILAQQHYETINNFLGSFGLKTKLITGNTNRKKESPETKEEINIFVGTHAILYREEILSNLGLVIIDEQHRFGVEQRAFLARLREAEHERLSPHVLTMTATPIPRSLALTFYGDLDLSVIDEMPKGRKEVKTFVVSNLKRAKAYKWIEDKIIKSGFKEQAFFIYPLIEESESETMKEVKAATKEFERLGKVFKRVKLGLLHGRLKSAQKKEILEAFEKKEIHILISTSVIEVGIDIQDATIMIIESAERFGLAQLHQLRGRVGRGDKQAYCFLFTETQVPLSLRRLRVLEKENCGIKLAEKDLNLRGPGEIFGTKQHGLPDLKVASVSNFELIEKTKIYAEETWEKGLDQYPELCDKLREIDKKELVSN